jgi:PilZ domain
MTLKVQPSFPTSTQTSPASAPTGDERRRRPRVDGRIIGWLISQDKTEAPWEVRILDVSRQGVGFETSETMQAGSTTRIRIGRGPVELARQIRIMNCQPHSNATFRIGAEFV